MMMLIVVKCIVITVNLTKQLILCTVVISIYQATYFPYSK